MFAVGDTVTLTGRIVRVVLLGGDEVNVHIETAGGMLWIRGSYLAPRVNRAARATEQPSDQTPAETPKLPTRSRTRGRRA